MPVLLVLTVLVIFRSTASETPESATEASGAPSTSSSAPAGMVGAGNENERAARNSGAPVPAAPPAEGSGLDAAASPSESGTDAGVPPPESGQLPADAAMSAAAAGHVAAGIASGALPVGDPLVLTGSGRWHVVPGSTVPAGTGQTAFTYTVEVEDGLQSPEQDQQFAAKVDATLADPRSWSGLGQVTLARIDTGEPSFRISLTSATTVRSPELCGWEVPLEASCYNRWVNRVLVNDARWVRGAMAYGTDLDAYRTYAINHEVGHALGFRHEACPESGAAAPVMMQQSWSTSNDELHLLDPVTIAANGKTCLANPYPRPDAVTAPAAPGSATAG